ncbi:DUF1868 domain-containing protein [Phyllobacterium lublinensis]|uniref:DUF1868 domain-containing protein n=1 Tax=Phyllobacterium lublinensis TaxID=2875708 RepID=UPI001CCCA872|nr:DUF1868 domain-containing protein [Phyllobacterium sp. 2063]MBZ9653434.1 DUF1868 domain-containing protein [Phyllobacterium sp. 2063]
MSLSIKASLARYAASHNSVAPRHLGTRYDANGTFLKEPGNTVVCHLVGGSDSERAILEVRKRMMSVPDAGRLTFTPASSLHMTLFQGIIEYRRALPYWPDDVPLDTSIDAMTSIYLERLDGLQNQGAFRIKVIDVSPVGLTVAGVTDEDDATIKAWRDALSIPFGYRHPDHDTYVFHITFAYPIGWLPDERLSAWQELLESSLEFLQHEAPVIEIRPPAFCRFNDMNQFEELLILCGTDQEAAA